MSYPILRTDDGREFVRTLPSTAALVDRAKNLAG